MRGEKVPVIAIDGPSGSGKSTIARLVAEALGFHLLNSGVLYRLTALGAMKGGVSLENESDVARVASELRIRFVSMVGGELQVFLDGLDVSADIRSERCAMLASKVAKMRAVRLALLRRQRAFRRPPGLVADGRDMGVAVFPDADLKVFLSASVEERAKRRYNQLKKKDLDAKFMATLVDLQARDKQDLERGISPLKAADDAVMLDSTAMTIEAVRDRVLQLARQCLDCQL